MDSFPNKKLFMVPWLHATILNGLRIKSTSFWEVYTLPPTTAELGEGDSIELVGIIIWIGYRHPEFKGISRSSIALKQYRTALFVIDLGAFVFPITYSPLPPKSKIALFYFLSIVNFNTSYVPSSICYLFKIE